MIKSKKKFICCILSLVVYIVFFSIYSMKHPITSKIKSVSITSFTNDKDDRYIKQSVSDTAGKHKQIFYGSDIQLSENAEDYVQIIYECKVKNHCFSTVSSLYGIVNSVPTNDTAFVTSFSLDPRQTNSFIDTNVLCLVFMDKRGLTDEELYEKIKAVKLDVIYKHKGKSGTAEVKGIDSIDSDDIEWD